MSLYTLVVIAVFAAVPAAIAAVLVAVIAKSEQPLSRGASLTVVSALGVIGGVASAAAFLTWEVGFTRYPNGSIEGPYGFWQLVGTALCAAGVCAFATARARHIWAGALAAAASTTLAYALTWAIIASTKDSTGLFLVGMIGVMIGGGFALSCVATLVALIRSARRPAVPR
ncbi:hypothetical protein [Gordonia sp. CPCC 205333]|uniref:hypothetical protein n=1 Tax=Gordonia sp. CPCC 205333 TaxID=3140790 RepID=UPI003AF3357C